MQERAPARVKIIGERNTSTNAVRKLIEGNSDSTVVPSTMADLAPGAATRVARLRRWRVPERVLERRIDAVFEHRDALHCWKHAHTRFDDHRPFLGVGVVICVRHPSSWLLALYRRPYHALGRRADSLIGFLDAPWKTVGRERMDRTVTTPPALYNAKLAGYVHLTEHLDRLGVNWRIVPFERFAQSQTDCFAELRPLLHRPATEVVPLRASTKDPSKDADFYRDYYGAERWRADIEPAALDAIRERIDWDVAAGFGYRDA